MKKYSFIIISFLLITQSLKAQYANKAWGDVVLYKIHIVTNGNSGFQAFWIPKTLAKVACHAFLHEEIHKQNWELWASKAEEPDRESLKRALRSNLYINIDEISEKECPNLYALIHK